MKKIKILFTLSSFLLIYNVEAQTEKGAWLLGSTIGVYNSNNINEIDIFNLDFQAGYFLSNKFVLGIRPIYIQEQSNDQANFSVTGKTFGLGVFGRYYFFSNDRFKPFLDLNVGYQTTDIELEERTFPTNTYYNNYGIGLNYWLTPRIAIEGVYRLNAHYDEFSFREMFIMSYREARLGIQFAF